MTTSEQLALFQAATIPHQRVATHDSLLPSLALDSLRTNFGLCERSDPKIFTAQDCRSIKIAKNICALCPVVSMCQALVLQSDERFGGVIGGLTDSDRDHVWRATHGSKAALQLPEIQIYIDSFGA